jgi:hypothetical protein
MFGLSFGVTVANVFVLHFYSTEEAALIDHFGPDQKEWH